MNGTLAEARRRSAPATRSRSEARPGGASSSSGKTSTRGPRGDDRRRAGCRGRPSRGSAARPTGASRPAGSRPRPPTSSTRPSGNEPWVFTHTQPIGTSHRGSSRPSMAKHGERRGTSRPTMNGRSAHSRRPTARNTAAGRQPRRPGRSAGRRSDQPRPARSAASAPVDAGGRRPGRRGSRRWRRRTRHEPALHHPWLPGRGEGVRVERRDAARVEDDPAGGEVGEERVVAERVGAPMSQPASDHEEADGCPPSSVP